MLKAALAEDESQVALLPTPGGIFLLILSTVDSESYQILELLPLWSRHLALRNHQYQNRLFLKHWYHLLVVTVVLVVTVCVGIVMLNVCSDAPPMDTVIFDESGDSAAEQSILDRSEPPPGSDDRGDGDGTSEYMS